MLNSLYRLVFLQTKIDRMQGADINGLEAKIQKHYVSSVDESGEDYGQGMVGVDMGKGSGEG